MRINTYASEQYRRTDALAERTAAETRTAPQASVTTTSFGFRLGNFGLDYESERTVVDSSLSQAAREQSQEARAFQAEQQVGALRAQIGAEGASYRDLSGNSTSTASGNTPLHRIKSAFSAYAKSAEETLPLPGSMLASVV